MYESSCIGIEAHAGVWAGAHVSASSVAAGWPLSAAGAAAPAGGRVDGGVISRSVCATCDPIWRHCQAGSLTGAVHLSNRNAGVPR